MNTIIEAVEKLRQAMVDADGPALLNLTGDELSYGHTSGLIENKQEFVEAIVGNNTRDIFKWIELSDQTILQSDDVAIVRHRFKAEVLVRGNQLLPDIHVMQVWQQKGDQWKLLARQAYKV